MDEATMKGPVPDPWRHRSDGMRCKTCMWFVPKDAGPAYASADPRGSIGRCRRHAPTMGGYPVVFEKDWCGDHRLDENKICMAGEVFRNHYRAVPAESTIQNDQDRLSREYSAKADRETAQKITEQLKMLRACGMIVPERGQQDAAD